MEDSRHVVKDHIDPHEICDTNEYNTISNSSDCLCWGLVDNEIREPELFSFLLSEFKDDFRLDFERGFFVRVKLSQDL